MVASIILATNAVHLDSDREYVDDIFYEIKVKDGIWTHEIPAGDYVRVTFEIPLDNTRDITVYAKSSGTSGFEVYEKDGTELIASLDNFSGITSDGVYLTNLNGTQDTFDILITGSPIQFDLIIDPNIGYKGRVFNVGGSNSNQTWTPGNAGNGHLEGNWVSYQYEIT